MCSYKLRVEKKKLFTDSLCYSLCYAIVLIEFESQQKTKMNAVTDQRCQSLYQFLP